MNFPHIVNMHIHVTGTAMVTLDPMGLYFENLEVDMAGGWRFFRSQTILWNYPEAYTTNTIESYNVSVVRSFNTGDNQFSLFI